MIYQVSRNYKKLVRCRGRWQFSWFEVHDIAMILYDTNGRIDTIFTHVRFSRSQNHPFLALVFPINAKR